MINVESQTKEAETMRGETAKGQDKEKRGRASFADSRGS